VTPLAERKGIEFTRSLPEGEAAASFDWEALEKVFANVLGNAFKFTPAGGHVRLSATRTNISGAVVLAVTVEDDGPGIPERDLPHVFERFYRAEHASTHGEPGTGLGLSLARDMVDSHGGVIQVDSAEGRGCSLTVRLPLLPPGKTIAAPPDATLHAAMFAALADEVRVAADPSVPAARECGESDDAPTILIVEDHADVRAFIGRHLGLRYRVIEAAGGEQALKAMRDRVPDLVVSDVRMQGMDGYALCRAIRADPELEFVPIVLLTAAAASEDRVVGFESGADGYLSKPFEMPELLARVAQLLASRQRLRERVARAAAAAVVYGTELPGATAEEEAPSAPPGEPAAAAPATQAASPRVSVADAALARRLREVIESRMGDEDFDVERLAEAMGMGRTLLFEKVGELTTRTPMELVFEHRLVRAAELLAAGEGGVGEIAYAVGFRSVSHFTHRFRQRFGVSPSAWKRGERGTQSGANGDGAAGEANGGGSNREANCAGEAAGASGAAPAAGGVAVARPGP
jgi:DNA-binding response OmpR family regulator